MSVKRKNLLLSALCLAMLLLGGLGAVKVSADSGRVRAFSGDGTVAVPYVIESADDLAALARDVNNGLYDGYYGVSFALGQDIDLTTFCEAADGAFGWIPIGTPTYPFKGTFDGGNHSITGLKIDRGASERVGLFGVTGIHATIENLSVSGSVKGGPYTGGIVGYNQGVIENCRNRATVSASDGSLQVGGVTGYNHASGMIRGCGNEGKIEVGFVTFAGGIAGSNLGAIENCYNAAALSSKSPVIGGIAGNNVAEGTIGVALNTGAIAGKSTAGGIAGNNQGEIKNAYNAGRVHSDNGTVGGIAGSNESGGTLAYNLSVSDVSGYEDVAAVCGYNLGVVLAGYYDSDAFDGPAVNGLAGERSAGFEKRILVHEDVLVNPDKLGGLVTDNDNLWSKRAATEGHCFYPQPRYFSESEPALSEEASKISRVALGNDDVTLDRTSMVYNGQSRTVGVFFGSTLLEPNSDYIAGYENNLDAGAATVSIEFINGFSGSAIKEFTIRQSELSVEWDAVDFIYDGKTHAPALKITEGLIGSEDVTFEYTAAPTVLAGEYKISARLANTGINANYRMHEVETTFVISPAPIKVSWSRDEFIYNGKPQIPVATVSEGRVGTEEIVLRYEYSENVKAGEQTVAVYLENNQINKNYVFEGEIHTYRIEKSPLQVVWDEKTLYYNGKAQYPTATVSSGRVGEEDIALVYSGYENNIKADETGNHSVTLSLADTPVNANYAFAPCLHRYVIYKAPLTLGWWDTPLTYNGQAQRPGFYIADGRIGLDAITFRVSDYSGNIEASSGSRYRVEVALEDTEVNENYDLAETIKTYDIGKADFNPRDCVEFRSRAFGYDGTEKSLFVSGNLPLGVSVSYENNEKTEIGEYLVTARFQVDPNNYNPLSEEVMTAKLYIARMIFADAESGITVRNLGEADPNQTLSIAILTKTNIEASGKKPLLACAVSFGTGLTEFTVPLSEAQRSAKGLTVLYRNSAGKIMAGEFTIVGEALIFSGEDVIEFALLAARGVSPLWISLGVACVLAAAGGVAVVLFVRKKRAGNAKAGSAVSVKSAQSGNLFQTESIETSRGAVSEMSEPPGRETPFILDGVECLSYNWFLKSLLVKTISKQNRICGGDRQAAMLFETIPKDTVFWQGKRYRIGSKAYSALLQRAKEAAGETE